MVRFLMPLLALIISIIAILLVARYPTGADAVSYDAPVGLYISIAMMIVLFLPPLILSLFNNRTVRIIFVNYQSFVVMIFLGISFIGLLDARHILVSFMGVLGALISIASILVTLKTQPSKGEV